MRVAWRAHALFPLFCRPKKHDMCHACCVHAWLGARTRFFLVFVAQKNTTCVMHVMYMHYHFLEYMSETPSFVRRCPQSDAIRTESTNICQKPHCVYGFADTYHVCSIRVGPITYIPLFFSRHVCTTHDLRLYYTSYIVTARHVSDILKA